MFVGQLEGQEERYAKDAHNTAVPMLVAAQALRLDPEPRLQTEFRFWTTRPSANPGLAYYDLVVLFKLKI
jgi:hypothetical protein